MKFALVLFSLIVLAGCAPWRAAPKPDPVTCAEVMALAHAIVDGRQDGQSRAEQRSLVWRGSALPALHFAQIDSIYDWPRPVDAEGWLRLRRAAVSAAGVNCVNRPAAALRGKIIP
ncbi:hypothetical protein MWU52_05580 [Jannaschia sp. S6380]|uniref:hypothetical protein n=1 Tax=Jannaschia sp. S6380 TaxID=2926408 RepID=UPI001FF5AE4B|nr:hypothetical protein [Jannaschia sp. S6380]MCK0167017.1 hypothetical protein [Jannaschia sp. S6380]